MASNHFHLNLQIILYLYSKFYCFLGGSRIYHIKVSLVSSHFHVNLQIILFIETVNKIHHIRVVVPAYLFSQSAFQRKDLTCLIHCHFAFRYHHQFQVPLPPFPYHLFLVPQVFTATLILTNLSHCKAPDFSLSIIATQIWYFLLSLIFLFLYWVWCNWLVLS